MHWSISDQVDIPEGKNNTMRFDTNEYFIIDKIMGNNSDVLIQNFCVALPTLNIILWNNHNKANHNKTVCIYYGACSITNVAANTDQHTIYDVEYHTPKNSIVVHIAIFVNTLRAGKNARHFQTTFWNAYSWTKIY